MEGRVTTAASESNRQYRLELGKVGGVGEGAEYMTAGKKCRNPVITHLHCQKTSALSSLAVKTND